MNRKLLQLIIGAALAVATTACGGKFLIVKSKLVESQRAGEKDVTPSPKYTELIEAGSIKKVAVRAPDACAAATAADTTGMAQKEKSVMSTRCGVEMGEIERALTAAGFIVISWRDLDQKIRHDQATALDAAKTLEADVLFQINSLEQVTAKPGSDARWDRVFCRSNKKGEVVEPANIDESQMSELAGKIKEQEQILANGTVSLAAMLDVNAVLVGSGQTIWFYRWIKPELSDREDVVAVHFQKKRGWVPIGFSNPVNNVPGDKTEGHAQSTTVSTGPGAANERQARYHDLVRNIVKDFAQAFASGQSTAATTTTDEPEAIGGGGDDTVICDGANVELRKIPGAEKRKE